jgi:hypothetical protein
MRNHRLGFGPEAFATILGRPDIPNAGSANPDDDGSYGSIDDHVEECVMVDIDGMAAAAIGPSSSAVGDCDVVFREVYLLDASNEHMCQKVPSVNYLAAGSCNFNDDGVTLWPLDQMVADTQYCVRDSVIDHITAVGTVSPAIEGRLVFTTAN